MARSNGPKLVAWLSRRPLSSPVLGDLTNSASRGLINGSYRGLASGCNGNHIVNNGPPCARSKNWFRLGATYFSFGATRSIHSSAFMSRDYYDMLGVSKDASSSELKKAFYMAAKEVHPDVNKDDPEAAKKMQELQEAYEVLKDDEKRSLYDQLGHDAYQNQQDGGHGFHPGAGFNPFGGMENIFNMFRQKIGGEDVKVALDISFMEAVQGCSKTVAFQTDVHCESCRGGGVPPGVKPQICKRCKGTGMVTMQQGIFNLQMDCSQCGGTGKTVSSFCRSCGGRKVVKGTKTVKVDIMAGVDDSDTIKVPRSGGADPEKNQPGDLFITIKVREDPLFRREGSNIHVDANLSVTQAILGGTVQVPTLTGDVVLKVRAGTQPGQKVVLKKKGIKARGSYSLGDQFVHFNVSIPSNLTERQRELIEEFAKEERGEDGKRAAGASG